jgi:hypothetical protein
MHIQLDRLQRMNTFLSTNLWPFRTILIFFSLFTNASLCRNECWSFYDESQTETFLDFTFDLLHFNRQKLLPDGRELICM